MLSLPLALIGGAGSYSSGSNGGADEGSGGRVMASVVLEIST